MGGAITCSLLALTSSGNIAPIWSLGLTCGLGGCARLLPRATLTEWASWRPSYSGRSGWSWLRLSNKCPASWHAGLSRFVLKWDGFIH
jgi:hypothetical protein